MKINFETISTYNNANHRVPRQRGIQLRNQLNHNPTLINQ